MTASQTVLITGASRGIGLQLATEFLQKGATVVAAVRNPDGASKLTALEHGGRLHLVRLDVADSSTFPGSTDEIKAAGISHLDIVINNAAVNPGLKPFEEIAEKDLLETFQINTVGPFLFTQQLKKAGLIGQPGTIIANISTLLGSIKFAEDGWDAYPLFEYRASKVALNMLTKHMDLALAKDNISVFAISPGYVRTDMNNNSGDITVEESAQGIIKVLESGNDLRGFWNYTGDQVEW
ncbi:hypothetical protein N2152v2_010903 [Parachlorella kessleri]